MQVFYCNACSHTQYLYNVKKKVNDIHQHDGRVAPADNMVLTLLHLPFIIIFLILFWRATVCWSLLCLCRPFCVFGRCSNPHCNNNPIYVFLFWELQRPQSLFPHSNISERFICIFPGSVYVFSCSRIGRPILGIYKSLTDTGV
jgi:hypothetical protein